MRLGKALATGVAEERPQSYESVESYEEQPQLPEVAEELEAAAVEEVPVAR
ncbi:hypothetical protein [Streptomyces sp. NPDC002845]